MKNEKEEESKEELMLTKKLEDDISYHHQGFVSYLMGISCFEFE